MLQAVLYPGEFYFPKESLISSGRHRKLVDSAAAPTGVNSKIQILGHPGLFSDGDHLINLPIAGIGEIVVKFAVFAKLNFLVVDDACAHVLDFSLVADLSVGVIGSAVANSRIKNLRRITAGKGD